MVEPPNVTARPELLVRSWGRAVAVVLICASVALLLSFDEVYEGLQSALAAGEPGIAAHHGRGAGACVVWAA